jgi:hypothetical protein
MQTQVSPACRHAHLFQVEEEGGNVFLKIGSKVILQVCEDGACIINSDFSEKLAGFNTIFLSPLNIAADLKQYLFENEDLLNYFVSVHRNQKFFDLGIL